MRSSCERVACPSVIFGEFMTRASRYGDDKVSRKKEKTLGKQRTAEVSRKLGSANSIPSFLRSYSIDTAIKSAYIISEFYRTDPGNKTRSVFAPAGARAMLE